MKKILIVLGLSALSIQLLAHNPKIATFNVRDTGMGWFVEMSFARSAIDSEMVRLFGETRVNEMEKNEFQELFIQVVKDNFKLFANGQLIPLGNGGIKLGSHQTDMKFVLKGLQNPETMNVKISLFEGVHNQANLLRVFDDGERQYRGFLSEDNGFQVGLQFQNGEIFEVESLSSSEHQYTYYVIVLFALLIISQLILRYKRRKEQLTPSV